MTDLASIKPLSEIICLDALQSKFLYPTDCKQTYVVNEKGALAESMRELITPADADGKDHIKFWEGKSVAIIPFEKDHSLKHILLKPLRVTARLVYFLGVSLTVAPAGVVWHGSNAALLGSRALYRKLRHKEGAQEDFQKVKRCANAAYGDLRFFVIGGLPVLFTASVIATEGGTCSKALAVISFVGIVKVAVNPINLANVFERKDERAAMKQAMRAKNDFGMMDLNGCFFKYGHDDVATADHPIAIYQMVTAAETVLAFIEAEKFLKGYNDSLNTHHKFLSENSKNPFPTYEEVIDKLEDIKDELEDELEDPTITPELKTLLEAKMEELKLFIEKKGTKDETLNLYHLQACFKAGVKMDKFFKKNTFVAPGFSWRQIQQMSIPQCEDLLAAELRTKLGR